MHASICDFIADIVQNAVEAKATDIDLRVIEDATHLSIAISDNGCGMSEKTLAKAIDPFFSEAGKHHRKMGLGLPFVKQAVELTEGRFDIQSTVGKGTRVSFSFPHHHLDTPPFGELPGTLLQLMNLEGSFDLRIERRKGDETYEISRGELIEVLGGLETASELSLAKEFLTSQEESLED